MVSNTFVKPQKAKTTYIYTIEVINLDFRKCFCIIIIMYTCVYIQTGDHEGQRSRVCQCVPVCNYDCLCNIIYV